MKSGRWAGVTAVAVGGALIIGRALQGAAARSSSAGEGLRTRTVYRWRCECGGRSRYSETSEFLAQCNADRHRLRKPVGHPIPEVYPIEE